MDQLPSYCFECNGGEFDITKISYNVLAMIVYYFECIECHTIYESIEEFGG